MANLGLQQLQGHEPMYFDEDVVRQYHDILDPPLSKAGTTRPEGPYRRIRSDPAG